MSRCRLAKTILSLLLCICLIAIPFVQRSYALVTTTTVVAILILTVLTAMGITLVIADSSKEDFILNKGDSFMQSKGYSGSFSDWIKGQSDIQIGLKVGFLMLAKDVVDRIKEFIDWLIPSPTSNSVVQLGNGVFAPMYDFILTGTVINKSGYAYFKPSGTIHVPTTGQVLTNGVNTVTWGNEPESYPRWTGHYDKYNLQEYVYIATPGSLNITGNNNTYMLAYVTEPYQTRRSGSNVWCRSGIYVVATDGDLRYDTLVFPWEDFTVNGSEDSAIIKDYDDLSGLTNKTVTENGTTTIYNTFYITQDGQALDGTGQDLADIVGALQQALDDLNRRLEVIPQTAATAAEATVEPDYSDFDLGDIDLSGLGALLTTRFPFCIPWDFARIFELFIAEPEAPHWEFNLFGNTSLSSKGIDGTIEVDLGDYPLIGQVSRWFCIIDFCLALCFITKKLVWVA